MKQPCEICRGARFVHLPIHRQMRVCDGPLISPTVDATSRTYPCPECADYAPMERMRVLEFRSSLDSRVDDPRYFEATRRSTAHGLIEGLLQHNLVRFEEGNEDMDRLMIPMRATVGVVSPTVVATLEERVEQRGKAIAREVVEMANKSLSAWGPPYIAKSNALFFVNEAMRKVLERK